MKNEQLSSNISLTFLIISAVLFNFGRFSVEFIMPLIIKSVTNSISTTGLVLSVFGLTLVIFELPCGWLSDTIGRQNTIIVGSIFGCLAILLYRFYDIRLIVIGRILYGISVSMFYPSMRAWISEISEVSDSKNLFGIFYALISIGSIFGKIIGGYFIENIGFIKFSLFSSFIVFSVVIPLVIYKRISNENDIKTQERSKNIIIKNNNDNNNDKKNITIIIPILLINFLWFLSSQVRGMAFPIYAREFLFISILELGFISGISGITGICIQFFSGKIANKIKRRTLILSGMLLMAFSSFALIYVRWIGHVILVLVIGSISRALIWPLLTSYMAEKASKKRRGITMAYFGLSEDLAVFIGPSSIGLLWNYFTIPTFPFYVSGLLAILTFIFGYLYVKI